MGAYWEQTSLTRKKSKTTISIIAPQIKRELSVSSSSSSEQEIMVDKDYKPSASIVAATHGVKAERSSPAPPLFHIPPSRSSSPQPNTNPLAWKHPAELEYDASEQWTDDAILNFIVSNAFSIPPKGTSRRQTFFTVTSVDGSSAALPIRYRIPLLWVSHYLWDSLSLVWTALEREREWGLFKYGILHVARLCTELFKSARVAMGAGMDRKWRCPMFDRALVRYRMKWLFNDPATVKEFWSLYGEKEFEKDVVVFGAFLMHFSFTFSLLLRHFLSISYPLRHDSPSWSLFRITDWKRWALKGHKGFKLTDADILQGVNAEDLRKPLKHIEGFWFWERSSPDGTLALIPLPGTNSPPPDPNHIPTSHSKHQSSPGDDDSCITIPSPPSSNSLHAIIDVEMSDASHLPQSTSVSPPSNSTVSLAPRAQMASFVEEVFTSFTATCKDLSAEIQTLRDEVRALREENISIRSERQHPHPDPYPYQHGIHVTGGDSISAPQRQFYTYPPPEPPVEYVPPLEYPDSPPASATSASDHGPAHHPSNLPATHHAHVRADIDTEMSEASSHSHIIVKTEAECSMPTFSPYTYEPIPYERSSWQGGLSEAMSMDDMGGQGLAGPVKSQRKRFTRVG